MRNARKLSPRILCGSFLHSLGQSVKIRKGNKLPEKGTIHKRKALPENLLRFSFRHIRVTEVCTRDVNE
jgi:hypothetical protein